MNKAPFFKDYKINWVKNMLRLNKFRVWGNMYILSSSFIGHKSVWNVKEVSKTWDNVEINDPIHHCNEKDKILRNKST